MSKIIKEQECLCYYEPRGDHSLEGFQRDEIYKSQLCVDNIGEYYRIYLHDTYYEICGTNIYKKYFKPIKGEKTMSEEKAHNPKCPYCAERTRVHIGNKVKGTTYLAECQFCSKTFAYKFEYTVQFTTYNLVLHANR